MNYPLVTIIVLNWNGLNDTIECLESLKHVTYPNFKIIITDNGSKGNDADILESRYGNNAIIIKNDRNYGFAGGNNIAINYAIENTNTDYILLLNNDTTVDPEFLTEMIELAESDNEIGIIGPKIYYYSNPKKLQFTKAKISLWNTWITIHGFNKLDSSRYNTIQDTDYCPGGCFLVKRSVIEKIGLLDSSFFTYWEETDYCFTAKEAGYKLKYCPKAKIYHKDGSGGKRALSFSFKKSVSIYYLVRNRFLFMKKHCNSLQKITTLLFYFGFIFWYMSLVYLVYYRSLPHFISLIAGSKDGIYLLVKNSE